MQIHRNYVTFNKIFIRHHTISVHADAKKVGLKMTQSTQFQKTNQTSHGNCTACNNCKKKTVT